MVGALVGVLAVLYAYRAITSADRGLVRERRVEHELEVLRGLASINTFTDLLEAAVILNNALELLPDRTDLALTRVAVSLPGTPEAELEYTNRYPGVPGVLGNQINAKRLSPLIVDGTYELEWTAAVERRVGSRAAR